MNYFSSSFGAPAPKDRKNSNSRKNSNFSISFNKISNPLGINKLDFTHPLKNFSIDDKHKFMYRNSNIETEVPQLNSPLYQND